jgi:peptide chain release factor 1
MANLTLFEKLDQIESRYDDMTRELSSPEVHADSGRYQKLAKTHAELGGIVAIYRDWKNIEKGLQGARELLHEADDPEMKQMAHDEERALEARRETVERELKILLLPKDPNDEKNVLLEIRAGTGGDEASLFAGEGRIHTSGATVRHVLLFGAGPAVGGHDLFGGANDAHSDRVGSFAAG